MKNQLNIAPACVFVAIAGLFFSACNKEQAAATTDDPAGTYTLVSVDGKQVPASVSHGGATLQVRSGRFTINADGTCSSSIAVVPPSGTETIRDVSATYTREGSKLSMQWKGAGKTVGTVAGNTFTMSNEGMLFIYKK